MKRNLFLSATILLIGTGIYFLVKQPSAVKHQNKLSLQESFRLDVEENETEAGDKRWEYEWKMLHDPATGKIPDGIYEKELELLKSIQLKQSSPAFRTTVNNTYIDAGPTQNGGRTRAVAFDRRNNQILIAAGISGGIFRSTNGGNTWSFVHPVNTNRKVSCLAQDPRPGFQDTWYAGTGELFGASAAYPNAFVPGNGVLKSTDNGQTWTLLASTAGGSATAFDNLFDIVFNIKVAPDGVVYAAILNRILRSADGGTTWTSVFFESSQPSDIEGMATDIAISTDGSKLYAALSGRSNDSDTAGVWQSTTGLLNSWSRIAGASSGPASVSGWRTYNNSISGGVYVAGWGRTVLAVAPSNANILYVMYDNAQSAANSVPEADFFKADLSSPTPVWSNRSGNLFATRTNPTNSLSYMELQGGYNMLLAVHPTNPDFVLAGGVNLYASTNGFSLATSKFIGGLESTTYSDPNGASHVDFHGFAFDPSDANRVVVASDGGLALCNNITATTVAWSLFNSQYQTFQYYHVAIDPTAGSTVFAGGAQDNSTSYRDAKGLLTTPLPDQNDHYILIGGDGGSTALSGSTSTSQYLYGSVQEGIVARLFVSGASSSLTQIEPATASSSEFVTYFHLDQENTNVMYYADGSSLYRTTVATIVTPNAGWDLMTGVSNTLNGSIFAFATTRGTYAGNNSYLYIGTDAGGIYRLTNPRDALTSATPVNITPSGMSAGALVRAIAVNPRNADTVIAVVSNYNVPSVYWTGNATSASPTWQVIEGNISLPSFRSCAIVTTASGVEYYVGTSIGLFSTTVINGNATNWTLEGSNPMRGAIISDLKLRIADNTLLVGTHGNGMFYTNIGNVATSTPDYIVNNKAFIRSVNQTVTNSSVYFQTGNATGIKKIYVAVRNMQGQMVWRKDMPYSPGQVEVSHLAAGAYILEIISDDRKYKHVQKFVKQ